MALRKSYDCSSYIEATLKNIEDTSLQELTIQPQQNKAQHNCVHILWDILHITPSRSKQVD